MNGTTKKCFIFTGGHGFCPEKMTDMPSESDFVIAADSGVESLRLFCDKVRTLSPDIIVGDMDSFPEASAREMFPDARYVPFPPEKDDTDTALAAKLAIDMGFSDIVIAGGFGGRADHMMANLFLLEAVESSGDSIRCVVTDGRNRCILAKSENLVAKSRKYLSVIPLDGEICGLSMSGVKYPLEDITIKRGSTLTVSNEITDDAAKISIRKGRALIIESCD